MFRVLFVRLDGYPFLANVSKVYLAWFGLLQFVVVVVFLVAVVVVFADFARKNYPVSLSSTFICPNHSLLLLGLPGDMTDLLGYRTHPVVQYQPGRPIHPIHTPIPSPPGAPPSIPNPKSAAVSQPARRPKSPAVCVSVHQQVLELGGLYVVGTARHESRRVDNQLRGRAGRQGDPGATRFFLSLDDDIFRCVRTSRSCCTQCQG